MVKILFKILSASFLFISCESSLCDSRKTIYPIEIRGRIINMYDKFNKQDSRPVSHTIIKDRDSIYDITNLYIRDYILGDSVYKDANSLVLVFYREDTLFERVDINCNCSYTK